MNDEGKRHGDAGDRRGDAEERHGDAATRRRGDKPHSDAAEARRSDDKSHADEAAQTLPLSASPRPRVSASLPSPVSASPPARAPASVLRLFCAVELSPEVRARAAAHIARLREKMPHVRAGWEREEKLHITMKFFGAVEHTRADALSQAIDRAAGIVAPFTLNIADAGAFPTHAKPRVLWLGVHDTDGHLSRLYETLEHECAAAGFTRDDRTFHPHITIARLRHPAGTRELADLHRELGFPSIELPVNEIVLMKSELGPKGSCYTALSHHGLAR